MRGTHVSILFVSGFLLALPLLTGGCSAAPDERTVSEVIIKHFGDRGYKVLGITLDGIRPAGMEDLQYMGTEGYLVNVSTLSLELTRDAGKPWNYVKGQQLTFSNGLIKIRKKPGKEEKWLIVHISGIPVP